MNKLGETMHHPLHAAMQEWLKKQGCGYFHVPLEEMLYRRQGGDFWIDEYLRNILDTCPVWKPDMYCVDVKIHMLMPNQFPCIPNWHYDMVPRDSEGKQDFSKVRGQDKMFLWLSNPPYTQFEDGREIISQEWVEFTQKDRHRGTMCEEHIWRMFIRVAPKLVVPPAPKEQWVRRHSQVYLDSENFTW